MININLLDWRARQKKINNNIFFVLAGVVALSCIIISSLAIFLFVSIAGSKQGNITYLNQQIQEVDSKIVKIKGLQQQKQLLLDRRKVIEGLQDSRVLVVRIFDNIARSVPDGVTLTSMSRANDVLTLIGNSDSNTNIAEFMKNIQQLNWVQNAELNEIKAAVSDKSKPETTTNKEASPASDLISFELKVTINPKLEKKLTDEMNKNETK